jgi:integrase
MLIIKNNIHGGKQEMPEIKKKKGKKGKIRFEVRYDEVKHGDRKQKQKSFRTKSEAEDFIAILTLQKKGITIATEQVVLPEETISKVNSGPSFVDYMVNWYETVYRSVVEATTFENRKFVLYKHLIPYFGEIPISDISTENVNEFISDKQQEGLSKKTVKDLYHMLNKALNYAVELEKLIVNPATKAIKPKPSKNIVDPWNFEEAKTFLDVAALHGKDLFYDLALNTGMRHGELLGLRWQDINFEDQTISISLTLVYTKKKGYHLTDVKTEESGRTIDISPRLMEKLFTHKRKQEEAIKECGEAWQHFNLVFPNPVGGYRDQSNQRAEFYELIKKAGVRKISVHGMRHTHATFLIRKGANPKLIQQRLGHSDVEITIKYYSHLWPRAQMEQVLKIEDELFEQKSKINSKANVNFCEPILT